MGKFRQCLSELSACKMIIAGYYSLMFLLDSGILANVNLVSKLSKQPLLLGSSNCASGLIQICR